MLFFCNFPTVPIAPGGSNSLGDPSLPHRPLRIGQLSFQIGKRLFHMVSAGLVQHHTVRLYLLILPMTLTMVRLSFAPDISAKPHLGCTIE